MIEFWNSTSLAIFDALLGWMLRLPSELAIILLALLTAGLMVLVRPLVTNQDLLGRVDRDNRRLKQLRRDAKTLGDGEAMLRYRATGNTLSVRKLSAEMAPLVIVIVPVAMLATWAMTRLEFHAPAEDETVEFVAYAPLSAAGELMHIVPEPGLDAVNGWVQSVEVRSNSPGTWDKFMVWLRLAEPRTPEPDAVVRWQLKGKANAEPYKLLVRFRDQSIERELLIGQAIYAPPLGVDDKDPLITTQTMLRPVKFFGIPGLAEWMPSWLIGYLIAAIPLMFLLKWTLNIY